MIQLAICDDNQNDLTHLKNMISSNQSLTIKIHEYINPQKCLKDIENGMHFDCFLLDILMNEDNGIDIAHTLRNTHPKTPLFFITATPEFALQGYEVDALRYYLKPIDENRFMSDFVSMMKFTEANKNAHLTINNHNGVTKINLDEIYYIESILRTITIHTKNQSYVLSGKISEFEMRLKDNDFIRVHKSFLVNLGAIHNIFKDTITMDNGEKILLSKHRSKETHMRFLSYVQEHI